MKNIKIFSCSEEADEFTNKICEKLGEPIGKINRFNWSDKKDQPRIPITAKLIAELIEAAGATRVLTCDLHNPAIEAYFNINCDVISARFELEKYFQNKNIENFVVVATDAGSSKKAYKYAEYFKCGIALAQKHREGNTDTVSTDNIIGEVEEKNALIFDDEIDTAGSILETAKVLKRNGAKNIFVGATHGILSSNAIERIEKSDIKEVVITDTVPHSNLSNNIKVLSFTNFICKSNKISKWRRSTWWTFWKIKMSDK